MAGVDTCNNSPSSFSSLHHIPHSSLQLAVSEGYNSEIEIDIIHILLDIQSVELGCVQYE